MASPYCKINCPHMCQMCLEAEGMSPEAAIGALWDEPPEVVDVGYKVYPITKYTEIPVTGPIVSVKPQKPVFYQLQENEIIEAVSITIDDIHKGLTKGVILA